MKNKTEFPNICQKHFRFLEEEFNCLFFFKQDSYGEYIDYLNSTTGISINFVPMDAGMVYVLISRLVGNKIPEYPIFVQKSQMELNTFDLEDLLAIRAPLFKIERPSFEQLEKPFKPRVFEKTIVQLSNALRIYAQDVLKGDFSIFSELDKIVKNRL
jgi:hypothetical protein